MPMLYALRDACKDCTMCRLGMKIPMFKDKQVEDHRVFSTMLPQKFMIVGQNPGYNECLQDEPFVGGAGITFNNEVRKNGIDREDFYITNVVRCYTEKNQKPQKDEVETCSHYLHMEIAAMRPLLVVTLGAVSFNYLCPGAKYSDALGDITYSEKFGVKVFAVYHPSPLNLANPENKEKFQKQVAVLCRLMKFIKSQEETNS